VFCACQHEPLSSLHITYTPHRNTPSPSFTPTPLQKRAKKRKREPGDIPKRPKKNDPSAPASSPPKPPAPPKPPVAPKPPAPSPPSQKKDWVQKPLVFVPPPQKKDADHPPAPSSPASSPSSQVPAAKPAAKGQPADKPFLPLSPGRRKRDDPLPAQQQFQPSRTSFGKKCFHVDSDDDDDDEPPHISRDLSVDAFARVMQYPRQHLRLDPLPAAEYAYDSVTRHPWFPELAAFLPMVAATLFPHASEASRRKVFIFPFFFLFFLIRMLCICVPFIMCVSFMSINVPLFDHIHYFFFICTITQSQLCDQVLKFWLTPLSYEAGELLRTNPYVFYNKMKEEDVEKALLAELGPPR
jgi:hypothetical protein